VSAQNSCVFVILNFSPPKFTLAGDSGGVHVNSEQKLIRKKFY